ncbi:MAG: hypothetical protein JW838_09165 [Spirochaetes bacterium]|nr:hypothetical protein [Spirochaetota bacterium]
MTRYAMKRFSILMLLSILFSLIPIAGCGPSLKNVPDIVTQGFLTDHCYRAIIVVEPDTDARGLAASRESSSRKAGDRSLLHRLALDHLVNHAMKAGIQDGSINRRASDFDATRYRERLIESLGRSIRGGRIVFNYYDENHSTVVGYEFRGAGLKNRVAAITTSTGE